MTKLALGPLMRPEVRCRGLGRRQSGLHPAVVPAGSKPHGAQFRHGNWHSHRAIVLFGTSVLVVSRLMAPFSMSMPAVTIGVREACRRQVGSMSTRSDFVHKNECFDVVQWGPDHGNTIVELRAAPRAGARCWRVLWNQPVNLLPTQYSYSVMGTMLVSCFLAAGA